MERNTKGDVPRADEASQKCRMMLGKTKNQDWLQLS